MDHLGRLLHGGEGARNVRHATSVSPCQPDRNAFLIVVKCDAHRFVCSLKPGQHHVADVQSDILFGFPDRLCGERELSGYIGHGQTERSPRRPELRRGRYQASPSRA